MKCPILRVIVQRQANEHINTTLFAHELPIMIQVQGGDSIAGVVSGQYIAMKEVKQTQEYARLEMKYGRVPESTDSWVERVYGPLAAGRLAEAMRQGMALVDNVLFDGEASDDDDGEIEPHEQEAGSYWWLKERLVFYAVPFAGNAKKEALEALLRNELEKRLGGKMEYAEDSTIGELSLLVEATAEAA